MGRCGRHYDEAQLAALVLTIAAINAFNRINAATKEVTSAWIQGDQTAAQAA